MKFKIFVTRDVVAGNFSLPDLFPNEDAARRQYKTIKIREEMINDIQVWMLGEYDDELGEFSIYPQPKILGAGTDWFSVYVDPVDNDYGPSGVTMAPLGMEA